MLFYEAAHAVTSLALGHALDHVVVHIKGDRIGGCTEPVLPDWYRERAEQGPTLSVEPPDLSAEQGRYVAQRMTVAMAGLVADQRTQDQFGCCFQPVRPEDDDDVRQMGTLAWLLGARDADTRAAMAREAARCADSILGARWADVGKVAWALYDSPSHRLSGDEVAAIWPLSRASKASGRARGVAARHAGQSERTRI